METAGSDVFRKSIAQARDSVEAALLEEIIDWANSLPSELCCVSSQQQINPALYLRLPWTQKRDILIRAFNWQGVAQITLWTSSLRKHSGDTLPSIQLLPGWKNPTKNDFRGSQLSPRLFEVLTEALEDAARKR